MAGSNFDAWVDDYLKEEPSPAPQTQRKVPDRTRSVDESPRPAPKLPTVPRPPAVPDSDFQGSTLQFGPVDTGIGIPNAVAKGLAQLGSGFADWDFGTKQLIHDLTGGSTYAGYDTAGADEKRRHDDPLNRGFAGTANNFLGKVLPSTVFPTSVAGNLLGRAAPLVTAPISGMIQGALEPVATGESRGANMTIGTGVNSMIPYTKYGMASVAGDFNPRINQLANEAARRGFKFGIADTSDPSSMSRHVRRVGEYFPVSKQYIESKHRANEANFTRETSKALGLNTDQLTEDVVEAQRRELNRQMFRLSRVRNPTPQVVQEFQDLQQRQRALGAIRGIVSDTQAGIGQRVPGEIRPQDLSAAVAREYPGAVAQSPFGDLPQIGQQFLRDTSTRNRDVLANFGIPVSVGATSGLLANPTIAAGVGGALGGAATLGITLPQVLSSPAVRRWAVGQIPDIGYGFNGWANLGKKAAGRAVRGAATQAPLSWREHTQADEALGPRPYEEDESDIPFIGKYLK